MNAVAPINRLSPELVAQIMCHGLPGESVFQRWEATLRHLRIIGSVTGAWRSLRDNTPSLWRFVSFVCSKDVPATLRSISLLDTFLFRSKAVSIDLIIDFDFAWRWKNEPSRLTNLIRPHLHRCRSLIISGICVDAISSLFPLPLNTPTIQELQINWHFPYQPLIIFGEGNNSQLSSLTLRFPRFLSSLAHLNFRRIVNLNLSDYSTSEEVLALASQFPCLSKLTIRRIYKNSGAVIVPLSSPPSFSFPILRYLEVEDLTFSLIMSAPSLQHLIITSTESYLPFTPQSLPIPSESMLRTVAFQGWGYRHPDLASIAHLNPQIRALEINDFPRAPNFLASLIGVGSHGPEQAKNLNPIFPVLELIRIRTFSLPWMPNVNDFVLPLKALLSQRPRLRVHWHSDNKFFSVPMAVTLLVESSGGRVTLFPYPRVGEELPLPLSELFSEY